MTAGEAGNIAFAILAVLAAIEIGCQIAYAATRRHFLFITSNPARDLDQNAIVDALDPSRNDSFRHVLSIHPYLGFGYRPGTSAREVLKDRVVELSGGDPNPDWANVVADRYGWLSQYPIPYAKRDGDVIVALFGDSLAQWFSLMGRDAMERQLVEAGICQPGKLILLNFSIGGGKQPQQLQALSFALSLGQEIDVVVNVDGINEMDFGVWNINNGVDLSMPVGWIVSRLNAEAFETADRPMVEAIAAAEASAARCRKLESVRRRIPSAMLYFLLQPEIGRCRGRFAEALRQIQHRMRAKNHPVVSLSARPEGPEETSESVYDETAHNWQRSCFAMFQLSAPYGVHFLQVFRPCLYLSKKVLTETEIKSCQYDPTNAYARRIKAGYDVFARRGEALKAVGINYVDSTDLFDHETENVFCEPTGHLSQLGCDKFGEFLGSHLSKILRRE